RSEWVRHPQRLIQGQASKKGIDRVAWSAIQANSAEQFSKVFAKEAASWKQKENDQAISAKG
ncbi:MAG: hypothetical protein ACK523_12990, partial [Pirellulaceae bacterium]